MMHGFGWGPGFGRYARGEIDREEFEQKRHDLQP
jgi:hypothetical protein